MSLGGSSAVRAYAEGEAASDRAVLFTAEIFQRARRRTVSYDETFRDPRDGCARHDDVWGGV